MESYLKEYKDSVMVTEALFRFFTNWNTSNIVNEMKLEDKGFKHAWEILYNETNEKHKINGGMWIISNQDLYLLFSTKLTRESQALLIHKVLKKYREEVLVDIDFSIKIEEIKKNVSK